MKLLRKKNIILSSIIFFIMIIVAVNFYYKEHILHTIQIKQRSLNHFFVDQYIKTHHSFWKKLYDFGSHQEWILSDTQMSPLLEHIIRYEKNMIHHQEIHHHKSYHKLLYHPVHKQMKDQYEETLEAYHFKHKNFSFLDEQRKLNYYFQQAYVSHEYQWFRLFLKQRYRLMIFIKKNSQFKNHIHLINQQSRILDFIKEKHFMIAKKLYLHLKK